ncbi:MAG: DUF3298 domain-containing protein [Rhodospirillales bacterium]|nr:DUF3298 domain-containing protein [Rhodospirillales bacterium]
MRALAVATLVALFPVAAFAQSGPSFDCAKASNGAERAICKDPAMAKADRELSSLYAALVAKLTGPARQSLEKSQIRWIIDRNRACVANVDDPDVIVNCLKTRYDNRIAALKASAAGPYPFIDDQSIEKTGKVGKVTYKIDLRYPRFAGTTADFTAINRSYADAASKAARETTPTADAGVDREQEWQAEQDYSLYRPDPNVITVALTFWAFTGGAHGYGSTSCTLVDLRTGKTVAPEGVFAPGTPWLKEVVAIVGADLKKQFVDNPGFEDALQPNKLTKTVNTNGHFCWQADRLQVYFNQYEVGPYAAGPYTVDIPYSRLKPLLRAGGLIAR